MQTDEGAGKQPLSGNYPFRHRLRRCHLPQGDGFSGSGKVSGIAQRRPLGGAGERSEPEGVQMAKHKKPRRPCGRRGFLEILGLSVHSLLRLRRNVQYLITGSGFQGRRYWRCRASRRSRSASGSARRHRSRCRRCRSCPAGRRWPASEQYRRCRTSGRR